MVWNYQNWLEITKMLIAIEKYIDCVICCNFRLTFVVQDERVALLRRGERRSSLFQTTMMQQNSFSAAAAAAAAAASGNPHILISDASSLYSVEELPDPRRRGQRMCRPLRWKNCRTSCSGRRCGARSDADSVRVGRCVGRTAGRAAVAATSTKHSECRCRHRRRTSTA